MEFSTGSKPLERAAFVALAIWVLVTLLDLMRAWIATPQHAWIGVAISVVVLIAALLSSVAGFAFSALAGCALAFLGVAPLQAVQTMVLCSIAIQLYAVWKIRDAIDWISLWPMLMAGAMTVPIGVWLLVHIDGALYLVGLGAFLMAYGCHSVMRRDSWVVVRRSSGWLDAAVGAVGGIAGGLAGLPGSFVTIWCSMRGWDKLQQRAVYQPYILAMQIVAVVCLRLEAPSESRVMHDLSYVPFALLGAIGGFAVFQRLTTSQFQMTVSVLLVASGVGLLGHAL